MFTFFIKLLGDQIISVVQKNLKQFLYDENYQKLWLYLPGANRAQPEK